MAITDPSEIGRLVARAFAEVEYNPVADYRRKRASMTPLDKLRDIRRAFKAIGIIPRMLPPI